jgi:hypothetical protein
VETDVTALDSDSSVALRTMLTVPQRSFRAFMVGSVMGSWVPVGGRPGRLRPGERAVATYVTGADRRRICALLGIEEKTWQNYATDWVKLRLAHQCSPGSLTLFANQLNGDAAICPKCRLSLVRGIDFPQRREKPSPVQGTSDVRIAASSSEDSGFFDKVELQGGEKGGPASDEITPEVAKRISEAEAWENLHRAGLVEEETG